MSIFGRGAAMEASTRSLPGEGPLRYRLYFWVMNAALVWQVGAVVLFGVLAFNPTEYAFWAVAATALVTLGFELIIMPLLVAIPVWRDEYAETLWKRTVYQIATLIAIVVPIMMFTNITFHELIDLDNFPEPFPSWYREKVFVEVTLFRAIMGFWGNFTLVFVILFQFNRWRDSRAASE